MLDFGARNIGAYNPVWTTVDPLAEKRPWESPYAYCGNNPVNAVDPDGMDYIITISRDKDGNITGITFSATVYITGDGANPERAKELNAIAGKTFISKEINGVKVGFDVEYKYDENVKGVGDLGQTEGTNVLYFNKKDGRSYMRPLDKSEGYTGRHGTIYDINNKGKSNFDAIHETAHFLGFYDRYKDRTIDGQEISYPDKGYSKDLMGSRNLYFQESHHRDMYNYVITPERIRQESVIKSAYFPSLILQVLSRTDRIVSNRFIDNNN